MSITERAKKNPSWLLVTLLVAHLIAISANRAPDRPDLWVIQAIFLSITSPIQTGFSNTGSFFKKTYNEYFSLRDSRSENERLRTELIEKQNRIIELSEQVKQLDQYKSLMTWQSANSYQGVVARVVGRDASEFFNTVVINKGTSSGISKNQPVVSEGGLVGRVIYAAPFSSRVLLITDERHATGAIIARTAENRLLGLVKGKSGLICELKIIATPGKIENGEQVLTSGQDGLYPKGLLIGKVILPPSSGQVVPQTVMVEPTAPLDRLETVSVLTIPEDQLRRPIDDVKQEETKQEQATTGRRRPAGR